MTLKSYLITMAVATALCWLSWLFIIFSIDPTVTNWLGLTLFYLSLFLSLSGSAAILGFFVRFVALKQALVFNSVRDAFRQSFLFSFLILAALFLSSQNLFNWLNIVLLVIGLSVLEYFLINYKKGA